MDDRTLSSITLPAAGCFLRLSVLRRPKLRLHSAQPLESKEQKSISLANRAEASYPEYRAGKEERGAK